MPKTDLKNRVMSILNGLDSGKYEQYGEQEDSLQADIDTVAELLEDSAVGEDVLRAYLKFWEPSGASVEVWEIPRNLVDHFRGNYPSAGAFIRDEEFEFASSSPDKTQVLEEYSEWIDWEGYAQSSNASDYTFVTLPDYSGVYVFRD